MAVVRHWHPESRSAEATERFLAERVPTCFSLAAWKAFDALHVLRAKPEGPPRVKFMSIEETQAAFRYVRANLG